MKLKVGVGSIREAEHFLDHGAEEIYCGFSGIPSHVAASRNIAQMGEVFETIRLTHSRKKKIQIAVNEVHTEKNPEILAHLRTMVDAGIDGIIIRDMALLSFLSEALPTVTFSLTSLALCYNREALKFYTQFNITRFTLPEHILPGEAEGLIDNGMGVETEVFFLSRESCLNVNGICFLQFGKDNDCLCRDKFRREGKSFSMPGPTPADHLGNLFDFHRKGVGYLKIGRSPAAAESRVMFREALILLQMLGKVSTREEFVQEGLRLRREFSKPYSFVHRLDPGKTGSGSPRNDFRPAAKTLQCERSAAEPEKALALTPAQADRVGRSRLKSYEAVYIGSEFCQHLLPSLSDLRRLREKFDGKIVLASSVLTDDGIRACARVLREGLAEEMISAVAVNDVGLLRLLKAEPQRPVDILLGRLLALDFIKMDPAFLNEFCRGHNIKMIETDEGNLAKNLPASVEIPLSFHHPWGYVAMSRHCPYVGTIPSRCDRVCEDRSMKLGHPKLPQDGLIVRNNAYFLRNEACRHASIARSVYDFWEEGVSEGLEGGCSVV